jgi:hypothetical protein
MTLSDESLCLIQIKASRSSSGIVSSVQAGGSKSMPIDIVSAMITVAIPFIAFAVDAIFENQRGIRCLLHSN